MDEQLEFAGWSVWRCLWRSGLCTTGHRSDE